MMDAPKLVVHIPISRAMLCCNDQCEAVFEMGSEECPACADRSIVPLQALLEHRLEVA